MTEEEFKDIFLPIGIRQYKTFTSASVAGSGYWDLLKHIDVDIFRDVMKDININWTGRLPWPNEILSLCNVKKHNPEKASLKMGWRRDDNIVFGQCPLCSGIIYGYHKSNGETKEECDSCGAPPEKYQDIGESKSIVKEAFKRKGLGAIDKEKEFARKRDLENDQRRDT